MTTITITVEGKEPVTFKATAESPLLAHDQARDYLNGEAVALKKAIEAMRMAKADEDREQTLKDELARIEERKTIRLTPTPVVARARARGTA